MNIKKSTKNYVFTALTACSLAVVGSCTQQTNTENKSLVAINKSRDIVMMINLVDDSTAISEYEKYHSKAWPEIIKASEAAGYEKIDIYRLGTKLVMVLKVPENWNSSEAQQNYMATSPRVKEWLNIMEKYQKPSPEAPEGTKGWATMKKVFSYEDGKQLPN